MAADHQFPDYGRLVFRGHVDCVGNVKESEISYRDEEFPTGASYHKKMLAHRRWNHTAPSLGGWFEFAKFPKDVIGNGDVIRSRYATDDDLLMVRVLSWETVRDLPGLLPEEMERLRKVLTHAR